MIFLFWSYLNHFKSNFDSVKSRIGLLNSCNFYITHFLAPQAMLEHFLGHCTRDPGMMIFKFFRRFLFLSLTLSEREKNSFPKLNPNA